MAYSSKNPRVSSTVLTDQGVSAVTSPSSGTSRMINRNGKLYVQSSAGLETPVGSASAGVKNYVSNPSAAVAETPEWVASSANIAVARTTTAANLPEASLGTALAITRSSGTTDYVRYRFTVDAADKSKKLSLSWYQKFAGASGDFALAVYSSADGVTYGTAITPSSTSVPGLYTGLWTVTFDTSTADYYEIRVVGAAGTTPLYLSSVTVTPGTITLGAAISGDIAFTPVVTNIGTTTNAVGRYRRIGNWMHGTAFWENGTTTTGQPYLTIPGGLNIDNTAIPGGAKIALGIGNATSGTAQSLFSVAGLSFFISHSDSGAHSTKLFFSINNAADSAAEALTQVSNASSMFNSGSQVQVNFAIPIAEWAGSGVINLGAGAQAEYLFNTATADSTDTTSFGYGPGGAQFGSYTAARSKRVRSQFPLAGREICLEISTDAGITWVEVQNCNLVMAYQQQNTNNYGIYWTSATSTDIDVNFATYRLPSGSTFGAAGAAWSGIAGSATYLWRVKIASPSAPVGFGLASATDSGLVSLTNQTFGGRKSAGNSKFLAYRTSAQSIPNTTVTKIQFNVEGFDTNGEYDNATNYRFTPTRAGYYQVGAIICFVTQDAQTQAQLLLYKNGTGGTLVALDDTRAVLAANTQSVFLKTSTLVFMNGTTDYLEVYGYQSSGTRNSGDSIGNCQFWGIEIV